LARLPVVDGDDGNWGTILNDYLSQSLKSDGTIQDNAVTSNTIASGAVTSTTISDSTATGRAVLTAASTAAARTAIALGNVDNTSDVNKPVSTAQQTAIDAKVADAINDGTTTIAPSQNAVFDALALKQPLDSDLTTIAGLTATTDNFMVAASSAWASRTPAQAKTSLALVKGDVGLGNVDNTSDANKPVSTATQTALDLKANLAAGIPCDFVWVAQSGTRVAGIGDFAVGMYVGRAFTITSAIYQFDTADASGNTVVELRKNGSAVTASSATISAANQVDGTGTDAARTVTPNTNNSFAIGDRFVLWTTSVGTTPGKGVRAYIKGTWN
jgi:hypothetical protein